MVTAARLKNLFDRFPLLLSVAKKLNQNKINWLISGSSALYVYGNLRQPNDVDIFLPDVQHDKVDELFGIKSYTHKTENENVRNSNPENNHSVQFTSHSINSQGGRPYPYILTPMVFDHAAILPYNGQSVNFMPPEEPLIVKAILRRGSEQSKNDLEDIENFLKIHPDIDKNYLRQRQKELGLPDEFMAVFKV